jgi:hypothetical protein
MSMQPWLHSSCPGRRCRHQTRTRRSPAAYGAGLGSSAPLSGILMPSSSTFDHPPAEYGASEVGHNAWLPYVDGYGGSAAGHEAIIATRGSPGMVIEPSRKTIGHRDGRRIPCQDSATRVCGCGVRPPEVPLLLLTVAGVESASLGVTSMRGATTLLLGLDGFRVVRVDVHDGGNAGAPRVVLVGGVVGEQACPDCGVLGRCPCSEGPADQGSAAWSSAATAVLGPAPLGVPGACVPAPGVR